MSVGRVEDRLVAIKRADRDTRELLLAEAGLLEQLRHPGLVELVDVTESDEGAVLRTVFAGADTWASHPVSDAAARAAGIAAIAATLADLHGRGVTHGRLVAEHVIHAGDDGRPLLCGLSRSGADSDDERRADMIALADLIDTPPVTVGPAASALAHLAGRARSGHLEAADLVALADRIAADSTTRRSLNRSSARRVAAASAGLVVVASIGVVVLAGPRRDAVRPDPVVEGIEPSAASVPDRILADPTTTIPSAEPTGVLLDRAGRRYSVGRDGDQVVVGDWNCDGVATPTVLRPDTGEIAMFDTWPEPDRTITTGAGWVIEDAREISVDPGAGCDQVRVHSATGSRILSATDDQRPGEP